MADEAKFIVDEKEIEKELFRIQNENKKANILICGQTGTGKSSAINYVFDDNIADVSAGKPCTRDTKLYSSEQINIFDSEGYEVGSESQQHYSKILFDDFLSKRTGNNDDSVHLVWYAISGAGKRITDLDKELVEKIQKSGFRVCVILTKIDELDEEQFQAMTKTLKSTFNNIKYFTLSTKDKEIPELKAYTQWDELIAWSCEQIPDIRKTRFISALKDAIKEKHDQAQKIISLATAGAVAAAASPIPFSDAAILIPLQTGMVIQIASLYGMKLEGSAIISFLGSAAISNLGKTVAGNLIKLIPGVGSVIGAMINGTVAGGFTYAIGYALNELLYKNALEKSEGKSPTFDLVKILSGTEFLNQVSNIFENYKKQEQYKKNSQDKPSQDEKSDETK
ncbi:DUF697 domain-containing protein [Campylobacter magnus]|uniref:DUF697 domain-containing protein n=1 Tax=Campylobacter magnus TaxID=3026462 RepID=UPI0026E02CEB|nr:DUF697 domain-containing protein [Campylobacter magnus]MDO2408326.1 DUF697 domain-containing protein [Campylobacter magnus]